MNTTHTNTGVFSLVTDVIWSSTSFSMHSLAGTNQYVQICISFSIQAHSWHDTHTQLCFNQIPSIGLSAVFSHVLTTPGILQFHRYSSNTYYIYTMENNLYQTCRVYTVRFLRREMREEVNQSVTLARHLLPFHCYYCAVTKNYNSVKVGAGMLDYHSVPCNDHLNEVIYGEEAW